MKAIMLHKVKHIYNKIPFCFILFILGFSIYAKSFTNGFVWTDKMYVDTSVISGSNPFLVFYGNISTQPDYYRPVTALYFYVLQRLFGENPIPYHVVQVLLFIIVSWLVYRIFLHFFRKSTAQVLALLHFLHPLNATTALFISAANGVLYSFFGLSAVLVYFNAKKIRFAPVFMGVLLVLSFLAKETALYYFCFILFHAIIIRGKKKPHLYAVLGAVAIIYGVLRFTLGGGFRTSNNSLYPFYGDSMWHRLMNAPMMFLFYLKNIVFPLNIGINHIWEIEKITFSNFAIPLLIFIVYTAALVVGGIHFRKKDKPHFKIYLFFSLLFYMSMVIILQIFVPLDYTVTSRWAYFPLLCFIALLGAIYESFHLNSAVKKSLLVAVIVIIIYFVQRDVIKIRRWHDDISLFTNAASVDDNFSTENLLATAYYNRGDNIKALEHINKSLSYLQYDNNLLVASLIHDKLGDASTSSYYAEKAFVSDNHVPGSHSEDTYLIIAKLLIKHQDTQNAQKVLVEGVKEFPTSTPLLVLLSYTQYQLDDRDGAVASLEKAQAIDPSNVTVDKLKSQVEENSAFSIMID
jgi:hypothetical protein